MIVFNNWTITVTGLIARQYDNLSRRVDVEGDLPAGYTWQLLVQCGGNADTILLEATETGAGAVLTADNLSKAGEYYIQLRGVLEADGVTRRHTNVVSAYIPESLTGLGTWPEVPTEFAQIEQRCTTAMIAAESAAKAAKADADLAAALAAEVAEKAAQTAQDATESAQAKDAAQTAQRLADEAQSAAEAARNAAETAQAAAEQSANDAVGAKQGAEAALKAAQDAAAAAAKALADIRALYQEMQTWAQGVIQDVNDAGSAAVQSVQSAGDTQVQRVTDEGTTQTANAKAQADAAAQSAAGAAQSAQQAAESAAVYDDVVNDVTQLKLDNAYLNNALDVAVDAEHQSYSGTTINANAAVLESIGGITTIDGNTYQNSNPTRIVSDAGTIQLPNSVTGLADYGAGIDENFSNQLDLYTGEYTQRVYCCVLDGSDDESWGLNTTYGKRFYLRPTPWNQALHGFANNESICTAMSNWFVTSATKTQFNNSNTTAETFPCVGFWGDGAAVVRIENYLEETVQTVSDFRAWLAENPLVLVVALGTPIVTKNAVDVSALGSRFITGETKFYDADETLSNACGTVKEFASLNRLQCLENLSSQDIFGSADLMKGKAYSGNVGASYSLISNENRISNIEPIRYDHNGVVNMTASPGYRISVRTIDDDGTVLADSGWVTGRASLNVYTKYRYGYTFGKSNDESVTFEQAVEHAGGTFSSTAVDTIRSLTSKTGDFSNVKAVAHRGLSAAAPENTLSAFKLARSKGFHYVETDVSFTSDGVPVLLHDDTVDRTSNGSGEIRNMTLEQAKTLDFGSWKSSEYAGESIPALSEFLVLCRNIGLIPRLELKTPVSESEVKQILDEVCKHGMKDKCEINCNDISVLTQAKNYYKKFPLVYGAGSSASVASTLASLKTDFNHVIWNIYYGNITDDIINACIENGIELEVWTVDSSETIENLNPYVSGVTSNSLNASDVLFDNSMR